MRIFAPVTLFRLMIDRILSHALLPYGELNLASSDDARSLSS
jgi:hypothetical protein